MQNNRNPRAGISCYERAIGKKARKAGGIYYTPAHIITYILERTVQQVNIVENPFVRVLDPACGSGFFLLAAYDALEQKLRDNLFQLRIRYATESYTVNQGGKTIIVNGNDYWREENLHQHLLNHCLFGADNDPDAVALAIDSLMAKSPGNEVLAKIIVCDSLIKWEIESTDDTNPERVAIFSEFWEGHFDYIIGNPPYIPVTRMDSWQKKYYRAHFKCAQGRLNTFVLFLERAVEKAACKIGMIVPSRLLLNTQYGAVRQFLLHQAKLESVYEAREGVFDGAIVDTVVLILHKGEHNRSDQIVLERNREGKRVVELVNPESLMALSGKCLSFAAGRAELTVVDALERLSIPLANIADVRDGIIQGAVGPELFLGRQANSDSRCKPVLFGHMIEPYSCSWQGEYIWYDPAQLTVLESERTAGRGRGLRMRNPAIFEHAKILSRQTADHIIAAMDTKGFYYMNTLHGTTVFDPDFDPWYVLALMNSEIIRCWYAWRFAETGRSFAQVKIANLRQMPVLILQPEVRRQIAQLAVTISDNPHEESVLSQMTIDAILYFHSGLDEKAIEVMKQFLKQTKTSVRCNTRREHNASTIN